MFFFFVGGGGEGGDVMRNQNQKKVGGDRKTTQNLWVSGQGATFSLQSLFMGLLPTHYYGKHFESL